jgi:hypothetical protein
MGTAWTADYLKITGELDVDFCTTLPLKHAPKLHSHDARDYLTRAVFMALGVGFVLSRRL